jgi:hypothetical protein
MIVDKTEEVIRDNKENKMVEKIAENKDNLLLLIKLSNNKKRD